MSDCESSVSESSCSCCNGSADCSADSLTENEIVRQIAEAIERKEYCRKVKKKKSLYDNYEHLLKTVKNLCLKLNNHLSVCDGNAPSSPVTLQDSCPNKSHESLKKHKILSSEVDEICKKYNFFKKDDKCQSYKHKKKIFFEKQRKSDSKF